MAVLAAPIALGALGASSATLGAVGFAAVSAVVAAGAGYLDSKFIMPGLLGKGKSNAQPPRLLGVPVGSNEPGAPRTFAIGRRVRVPTHILWQSEKTRDTSFRQSKGGAVNQRSVLISAAVAVNDRVTKEIERITGNDKLIIARNRNLIAATSSEMTATESGGLLTLEAGSVEDVDFTDRFAVGDYAQLRSFGIVSGASCNVGQFSVESVTSHGASDPSTMVLKPVAGQSISGCVANGGTAAAPARVERVDDALIGLTAGTSNDFACTRDATEVFAVGDEVRILGGADALGVPLDFFNVKWRVGAVSNGPGGTGFIGLVYVSGTIPSPGNPITQQVSDNDRLRIEFFSRPLIASGLMPSAFNPDAHYYEGSDSQSSDSIVEADVGVGLTPAFRGVAYQVLQDLAVTQFGDSLPFDLSAVVSVDVGMTWQEAVKVVCERGGVTREFVDTLDVTPAPFEGYFTRGAIPGATALMPLLIAGQLTTQERDGIICFQDTDAADVVQIENGEQFSDLGAAVGSSPSQASKFRWSQTAIEDLPTSIGIRHQDPDNAYADGYQHFGIRNPNAGDNENRQEFDLSNLVLTRKQARNLAGTVMRRTWVNSRTVDLELPCAYLHILEGDLLTFTDDEGNDYLVRVTQRDLGTNFLVRVQAVAEQLDLAVAGSPVQTAAGVAPVTLITPPPVDGFVLDLPPIQYEHQLSRGLYVAATAPEGSQWAGCAVFVSLDSGANWTQRGAVGPIGAVGTLTSAIVPGSPADTYGATTTTYHVTFFGIQFDNSEGVASFASVGDLVEQGVNWFAIIDPDGTTEIIAIRDVIQTSSTEFIAVNLLRGLRGTWAASAVTHPVGARIIAVDSLAAFLSFPATTTAPVNVSVRFVPPGKDLADVESVSVVPTWRSASPFDVRKIDKSIDGVSNDATFTVENWTRTPQPIGTLPPYPLDESVEAYRLTIYDPSGNVIVRTKTLSAAGTGSPTLVDPSFLYTAAEQTADGYTPSGSTTFWVAVQQIGDFGDSRRQKRQV